MRLTIVAGLAICSIMTACNRQGPDEPVIVTPSSTFSAKVDGKSFVATEIQGSATASSLYVTGTSNAGTGKAASIALSLPRISSLAAYPIDSSNKGEYRESGVVYKASSGSINITTNNDVHVAGGFSFDAGDSTQVTRTITSGSFDLYK